MSEHGYICLDRGALNHEFFRRDEYSEFEAWVWLLTEAAWKPRQRRIGDFLISLERGQLVASIRHLMRTWAWSQGKVNRFIDRLKNESMVDTRVDTGITVITVCNYDKYQIGRANAGPSNGPATDTEADQKRTRGGYNTETIKQSNIETVDGASAPTAEKKSRKKPARPMPDIFPMSETMRAYAESRGYRYEIPVSFANLRPKPGPAQEMFEAFKNHHRAKGSLFADWEAAWRTWVNNQVKFDTDRGKPPGLRPAI